MASAIVGVVVLIDAVVRGGWVQTALLAPWILLALWGVWVSVYASCVVADAEGVTVQNLLRRTRASWGRVTAIELRYQVVFSLDDGRDVAALGGPLTARSRRAQRAPDPDRLPVPFADAERIRARWTAALERGATGGDLRRSWDVAGAVVLAVLLVWAAVAVVVAYR